MRLPRGTFCEIKKAELISSILDDLLHKNFSGVCSISSVTASGTLVFKSGTCILAKILDKSGDGAWDELQKLRGYTADAALSSLDDVQVRLALEFNKSYRIIKDKKTVPAAAPAYATPKIPVHDPQEPKKPAETEDLPPDASCFEKDIETFETLDLDNATDKIRNDCKTMIKKLQLDHLMER